MSETKAGTESLTPSAPLCLDFINTISWRTSDHPQDSLTSYSDLVKWGWQAGVITEREARQLLREGASRPKEANTVFARAVQMRGAIYRIFSALAADRRPETADLDLLNDALSQALSRLRVKSRTEGFTWSWADTDGTLDRVLWPVARSAAELLVSDELSRVRECAGEGCGWLFVDVSRNRLRRWCDMKSCGNRAKARRYYERVKAMR